MSVFGGHEDIANARIEFEDGCVANLTASRASYQAVRKMRLYGDEGYATLDFATKQGTLVRPSDRLRQGDLDLEGLDLTQPAAVKERIFGKILRVDQVQPEPRPADAGTRRLRPRRAWALAPRVSGEDALRAMRVADQVLKSLNAHTWDGRAADLLRPYEVSTTVPAAGHTIRGPITWRIQGTRTAQRRFRSGRVLSRKSVESRVSSFAQRENAIAPVALHDVDVKAGPESQGGRPPVVAAQSVSRIGGFPRPAVPGRSIPPRRADAAGCPCQRDRVFIGCLVCPGAPDAPQSGSDDQPAGQTRAGRGSPLVLTPRKARSLPMAKNAAAEKAKPEAAPKKDAAKKPKDASKKDKATAEAPAAAERRRPRRLSLLAPPADPGSRFSRNSTASFSRRAFCASGIGSWNVGSPATTTVASPSRSSRPCSTTGAVPVRSRPDCPRPESSRRGVARRESVSHAIEDAVSVGLGDQTLRPIS